MTLEEFKAAYGGNQSVAAQAPVQSAQPQYNNQYNEVTPSVDSGGGGMSLDEFKEKYQPKEPTYSVEEASRQANNGQSYAATALANMTGTQPEQTEQKLGIFDKPEVKTTPERDALLEEYSRIQYSNAIPAVRRKNEIKAELDRIDQELGNGKMDHTFGDRSASVIGGSAKGWAADMMNAAGTAVRGMGEFSASANPAMLRAQGLSDAEIKAELERASAQNKGQRMTDFGTEVQGKSDKLAQESATDIERAKKYQTRFAQFGTDTATNAVQMGMDQLATILTFGIVNPMTSMFVRSVGGSAREARQEGASTGQQLAYGAVRGGIEVATEKMFDGLAKIYGAGFADEAVERLIGKLGKGNDAVQTGLRALFSGIGESLEEGASGLTEPLTKMIYQGIDALKEYKDPEYWAENMYGMLVGAAMGSAGGAVNIINGENRKANAEIKENINQQNEIKNNLIENNGMSEADATKASEILAKIAKGETITKRQAAFLDSVQEANGINIPKTETSASQAEVTEQQTQKQPSAETPVQQARPSLAEQRAQAEAELKQAQDAYEAAENDPEMQQPLLEAVEAAQEKLDGIIAQEQAEQDAAGTTPAGENGENWGGPQVKTQSTFHRQLTDTEKTRADLNPENDTHTQHHDTEVDTFANNRIAEKGHEGAREDLMSRNPAEWDDVDVRTAQMLLTEELNNARNLEGEEQDAAYRRIAELKKAYNQQGTEDARALRQRSRFGGTKAEIVSEAANILYGDENAKKLRKVSPEQKSEIMKQVDEFSSRLENVAKGDAASIKDIILQVAQIRNTHANFDANNIRLGKAIDAVAKTEGGEDFLRQLATTQIRSIASDQIKPTFWDKAKAVRYLFMLSNPATASRNVWANTVFGNVIDAISSDMASPIDSLMSLATGQKTIATERLSKEGIKGSIEAGLKSWLEVSLDAEAEQSSYAYNEIKGRTFKASSGNFVERFMSALERNQGYQLKTTDQIAKGGIEAEIKRNLIKQGVDPETAAETAKEEAKYRTLQNESWASKAAQDARNLLNRIPLFPKDPKTGKRVYGLGDDLLPFAQVPANVVKTELDLNPLSIFKSAAQVFSVMAKGENATAQEQRNAAKAFGQAVNGTAIVALSALMSAKGIIRYTDDEDKDQAQLHKAQGKSGLQLDLSAAGRLFSFRNPSIQADDNWISLGWMPQLNSLLIIGNMVYDDYKDMPEHKDLTDWAKFTGDVAVDSLQGIYKSILEFPAVSTITSMINAAKYADVPEDATPEEKSAIKTGAVLADKVANTVTSFTVPNVMRAVAAGLDDTERNLYSAETRVGQAIDSVKAGIPDNPLLPKKFTRGSLPALTDNLGNPFKNEGGGNQLLNKLVRPGAITKDKSNSVLDEIDRISSATGNLDAIPKKNGAYSVSYGEEKYKLTNEEREAHHQFAGDRIEKYMSDLIESPYYSIMTEDQIAETMAKINQQAYNEADKNFLTGKGIKATDSLIDGVEKPGDTAKDKTKLDESNMAKYFAFKTVFDSNLKAGDYSNTDQLAKWYSGLDSNLKTVLHERDTDLKRVLEYQKAGLGSEHYTKIKAQLPTTQEDLDASSDASSYVRLYAVANADISEQDRIKVVEQLMEGKDGFISKNAKAAFSALKPYGFTVKQTAEFFDIALHCATYKDSNDEKDYKGKLMPDNVGFALLQVPWLTDPERTAIYNDIRAKCHNDYKVQDWGRYTFSSEKNWVLGAESNSKSKATYSTDIKITDRMDELLKSAKK